MNNCYPKSPASLRSGLAFGLSLLAAACPAPAQESAPVPVAGPVTMDFQSAVTGELPDDLVVTDGDAKFTIVAEGDNKMLEMNPSPLVDGGVLLGTSIKGPATVKVRVKAAAKRRSFPRFGVGLHGAGGFRCLVVPAMKELQIVRNDEVVAKVPWSWKAGAWTMVEFSVRAAEDGGSTLEARVWEEGQPRPGAASIQHKVPTPPGTGKASLWAAPYAELPIAFDDVVVEAKSS